jgi:hypothetical protein
MFSPGPPELPWQSSPLRAVGPNAEPFSVCGATSPRPLDRAPERAYLFGAGALRAPSFFPEAGLPEAPPPPGPGHSVLASRPRLRTEVPGSRSLAPSSRLRAFPGHAPGVFRAARPGPAGSPRMAAGSDRVASVLPGRYNVAPDDIAAATGRAVKERHFKHVGIY